MRPVTACVATLIVALSLAGSAAAEDMSDLSADDRALRKADHEVLEAQRDRFRAIFFSKDPSDRKRAEQQFSEAQKKRRRLLDASGQ